MAMNTVNVLEDSSTGKLNQNQKGTNGAAHVRLINGTGEITKNRLINPDATPAEATNRVTWTQGENTRRFRIWAYPDAETNDIAANAVAHIEIDISYSFVIDSVNYASGNLLLSETGGADVDVQMFKGQYNEPTEWFDGTSYFTSVQFSVPVNSKIYIEAQ